MSRRHTFLTIACLLIAGARTTVAQTTRPFKIEVGGGATFLTGDDRTWFKDGYNVQAGVGIPGALPGLELLGTVFYHGIGGKWKSDQVVAGAPDTLRLGDFSVLAATAGARWHFLDLQSTMPVRPYATLGAGIYRIESKVELYGNPASGSATKFGATFGFGLDLPIATNALFIEARVHNVFTDAGSSRLYPVTVGFRF
jgi:opacity protein-like surface antigen